jgi:hypothetical protein
MLVWVFGEAELPPPAESLVDWISRYDEDELGRVCEVGFEGGLEMAGVSFGGLRRGRV